jgi:hypothetical protein
MSILNLDVYVSLERRNAAPRAKTEHARLLLRSAMTRFANEFAPSANGGGDQIARNWPN